MSNPEEWGGLHDPYKKGPDDRLWRKDPEFDFENKKIDKEPSEGKKWLGDEWLENEDNDQEPSPKNKEEENKPPEGNESDNRMEKLEKENADLKETLREMAEHLKTRTDIAKEAIKQAEDLKTEQPTEKDINFNELLEKDERDFKKWLHGLDPQAQEALFKEIPGYRMFVDEKERKKMDSESPEYTGSEEIPQDKDIPVVEPQPTPKEKKELSYIRIPAFDPKKYFSMPNEDTFDPDKPFKERNEGSSAKAQWAHATYRKGYGRAGLNTERKRGVEETTEQLQEQEKIVLSNYYQELIEGIEKQGGNLESDEVAQQIRETMVDAKKELERHFVKNYGSKVYQERRSNWWRRFRNFLNSDILERKTLGDASDIVAINGGTLGDPMATIENITTEEIVARMNAHVRRSIKKSLDWSGKKDGYTPADDKRYDRYQTYRILQDTYLQRMAQDIGKEGLSTDNEGMVNSILEAQKTRLETVEKGVKQKRIKDLTNKLLVVGITSLITISSLLGVNEIAKAHLEKSKDTLVKSETKIEQVISQETAADTEQTEKKAVASAIDEDVAELEKVNEENIIIADVSDTEELHYNPQTKETTIVAKELSKPESSKDTNAQNQKFHTLLSKIQVSTAGVEDNYIPKAAKLSSLKKLLNTYSSLDSTTQARFNKYVHESGGYGSLAESMHSDENIDEYATRMIQELQ